MTAIDTNASSIKRNKSSSRAGRLTRLAMHEFDILPLAQMRARKCQGATHTGIRALRLLREINKAQCLIG